MILPAEGLSLEEVVAAAAEHERDHPTHGTGCACLDSLIRRARHLTTIVGSSVHDPGADLRGLSSDPEHPFFGQRTPWRQQARVDYVLSAALRSRS